MNTKTPLNVAVLDMQPIEPATGGGRLRLLGLYHALGPDVKTLYVGTYDWPGPGYRRQMLSQSLEELLIPLSAEHFAQADARSRAAGGRVVIDSIFHELAHLSPDYVDAARKAALEADVVVFSHPWIYPLVRDVLDRSRQLIVYDAHNVEGLLRMELLDDGGAGTDIVREVIRIERELCQAADLILACSHEDRAAFNRLYGVAFDRMRVFANGTFTANIIPATPERKAAARASLKLGPSPVAFFIGSNYVPNAQAARFIADKLCPALPHILFVVAGGVSESLADAPMPFNLRSAGSVSEDVKKLWLQASDVAINPMFGGSGTNIKMLDYMAAGLPIVTTHVGARGIVTGERAFVAVESGNFAESVRALVDEPVRMADLSKAARTQVEMLFSWERISAELGVLLRRHAEKHNAERPCFSVVIPTFERHHLLSRLIARLEKQSFRRFETIVVDQSSTPWADRDANHSIDILYYRTDVKGPGFARNTGAKLARGTVIAFVDDDCEPFDDWLESAEKEFREREIIGLEGLVVSGRMGDPDWRAVTNEGFEGLGFMTANLFLRAEAFHCVNGFDAAFGDMPFREDTDLGWRAQELGAIPFSKLAKVYHPPQPRAMERESLGTRSRFFERDALLMRKHPRKYAELMRREAQWATNPYFWTYLLSGIKRYDVKVPDEVLAIMPRNVRARC
ncbi:MAG TPA: glycosyltransferase [Rhizomicrobium sp.]|jgi:glycosyltransferase involved in cell wall biosynthesis